MNQFLKVPSFEPLQMTKNTQKIMTSPRKKVQYNKVKRELKLSQQSKINFRPSTSFLNANRKCLQSSKQNNHSKRELIKKMVYLSEFAVNNNQNIKNLTPVKAAPIFTPRRTPRVREYLVLPEFSKKPSNISEIRSNLKDFIRKETMKCPRPVPLITNNKDVSITQECEILNKSYPEDIAVVNTTALDTINISAPHFLDGREKDIKQLMDDFQMYNNRVTEVIEKLQMVEDCFDNAIRKLPEEELYAEFCLYLTKKQELSNKISILETEFVNILKNRIDIGNKLKLYMKENQTLFQEYIKLHEGFEKNVNSILSKSLTCEKTETLKDSVNLSIDEKPLLRRSLRLSKLPKKEGTPMQKKLSRLNIISKGIQKNKNSTCRGKGRVLQL